MEIYELGWPGEEYATLGVADEKDKNLDDALNEGKPQASMWSPVRLRTYRSKRMKKELPDCNNWLTVPVFSERAVQVLGDFLTSNGELLPVHCDERLFYAYNVLTVIPDALDEEGSELNRFSFGKVMNIYRYEFWPDRLQGATIFKIPQQIVRVYVTDAFVKRASDAGLTGFGVNRLWTESAT